MPRFSEPETSVLKACFGKAIDICSVCDDIEIYLSCSWDGSLSG